MFVCFYVLLISVLAFDLIALFPTKKKTQNTPETKREEENVHRIPAKTKNIHSTLFGTSTHNIFSSKALTSVRCCR